MPSLYERARQTLVAESRRLRLMLQSPTATQAEINDQRRRMERCAQLMQNIVKLLV